MIQGKHGRSRRTKAGRDFCRKVWARTSAKSDIFCCSIMPVQFRDYYETLGVPKTATSDDIRKAFRKLARKYHPDVAKDKKTAEEKFKQINEAYEVLSDKDKREKFDRLGADWQQYGATGRRAAVRGGARAGTRRGRRGAAGRRRGGRVRFRRHGLQRFLRAVLRRQQGPRRQRQRRGLRFLRRGPAAGFARTGRGRGGGYLRHPGGGAQRLAPADQPAAHGRHGDRRRPRPTT